MIDFLLSLPPLMWLILAILFHWSAVVLVCTFRKIRGPYFEDFGFVWFINMMFMCIMMVSHHGFLSAQPGQENVVSMVFNLAYVIFVIVCSASQIMLANTYTTRNR